MQTIGTIHRMIRRHVVAPWFFYSSLVIASFGATDAANAQTPNSTEVADAAVLNLSKFYQETFGSNSVYESFSGRQVVDGIPFQVDGRIRLYGKTRPGKAPDEVKEILVGRKFADLNLIHFVSWPDVDGQSVASFRLNYEDGTEYIASIRYGVHVRDAYFLPSFEKDSVSDPDSTICWRHPPVEYKAPLRVYKSRFENPSPEKIVRTLDIISARNLSSYTLLAATVSGHHPVSAPKLASDRAFGGSLVIRVVDDVTGKPIVGALVSPGMNVIKEGVVGSPFHTSATGEGTIPYPIVDTTSIYVLVEKTGYQSSRTNWQDSVPGDFTFRLSPVPSSSP